MKLYTAAGPPNPRRVEMFLAEKGIHDIERVLVDLNAGEHKKADFLARNPRTKVPLLELDDGRFLAESRAICSYLETVCPSPNLMGRDGEERAFIEMIDRQIEFDLFSSIVNCVRHTHPGLAALEQPQFADFGTAQGQKMREAARWFDSHLAAHPYAAGERFTIADITAFCAIEFARLVRFKPGQEGMANLQAWRDRIAGRASASA
ncbi:glutathione S-transferase family protein [Propionivibrio sp.]|uniref:glutathione S-transferase family protein n=1 Tax=Propionivibrio sp. TaxID=2212460 RepID=UPI003BF30DE6